MSSKTAIKPRKEGDARKEHPHCKPFHNEVGQRVKGAAGRIIDTLDEKDIGTIKKEIAQSKDKCYIVPWANISRNGLAQLHDHFTVVVDGDKKAYIVYLKD